MEVSDLSSITEGMCTPVLTLIPVCRPDGGVGLELHHREHVCACTYHYPRLQA